MPYETDDGYERARKLGHVPIVENELVQEELGGFSVKEPDPDDIPVEDHATSIDELPSIDPPIEYLLSFDGSNLEVATNDDYPSNRIGFIQIAGVLTRLDILESQEREKFVNPAEVKKLSDVSIQDIVMPSTNYCLEGAQTTRESWRHQTFKTFKNRFIEDQSLLTHFLETIDSHEKRTDSGTVIVARCPAEDCNKRDIETDPESGTECPSCGTLVFPTDTFRIHETVSDRQMNGKAISNLMSVIEHLSMVAYLQYLHKHMPERLSRVGFVIDGPLAQFDTCAWFHKPILSSIKQIYRQQVQQGYSPPMIVGIEKSGAFADHAQVIKEHVQPNSVVELSDEYIFDNIIISRESGQKYGRNTYYGQKFIHRSNSGRTFVVSVPKRSVDEQISHAASDYPLLRRTLETLQKVETALYGDSLIPVALAHAHASIPLKSGGKVLELFAREMQST